MSKRIASVLFALTFPLMTHAGPYIGGLVGYGVMNLTPDLKFAIPQPGASVDVLIDVDFIGQGFMGSPVVGYEWQWDRFRLGTELQAFWSSLTAVNKDTGDASMITISLDHEYVWLVRPAYQLFDDTPLFLYLNLGATRAKISATPQMNAIQAVNFNDNVWGYKAGFGFGYDMTQNLRARLDYIFSQYQTISNTAPQDIGAPEPIPITADLPTTQSQYLIGLTYNW